MSSFKQLQERAVALVTVFMLLLHIGRASSSSSNASTKEFRICDMAGGAGVTREASRSIQTLFREALDDVEYMRETWTETMKYNPETFSGITLEFLANTLDWEARGLPSNWTTLDAGLAWADDRPDRRMERLVGLLNEPHVGNKSTDLAMIDLLSSTLPWIVDRRSKEALWWKDHENGRSEGTSKPTLFFDRLYIAAYCITWGGAANYYPPMTSFVPRGFNLHDIVGAYFSFDENEPVVIPNLRENNPLKLATIGKPYADKANPGMSIVSAHAPVYYTGEWLGFNYNDTYVGLTGIDLSIDSMSTLLHRLDGTVTRGSFGVLVDGDFNIYVITQDAVSWIYPERTGFEEFRVHRDKDGEGEIVDDRRNQTYMVSDTILQPLTNLSNANWLGLNEEIRQKDPGHRGSSELNVTLTGDTEPTLFYVMYDKWDTVGDFTLLLFAPQEEVDRAVECGFESSELDLEALVGTIAAGEAVFVNTGALDITARVVGMPSWAHLEAPTTQSTLIHLGPGEQMRVPFIASTEGLPVGFTSSLLTVLVQDDDYPDCFYNQVFSATITIEVQEEENLHQLGYFRIFGFVVSAIVMAASIGYAIWVAKNAQKAIVNASQPFFLYILCFGTFIMGASIIPLAIDDSLVSQKDCSIACMMFPWMLALGFSISFSAVFSKVWRVSKLFEAAGNLQRATISPRDVMVPFCVIITLNVVLLLTWTLADPLTWERVQKSSSSSYGTCWSNLSGGQLAMLSLLAVVNYSALALAIIQAYLARNIADEFSESKYIFLAMFGMLEVSMIGLPVMFLVLESPPALFFVQSTLVFAISMSLLLWIFVPKVRHERKYEDRVSRRKIVMASKKSMSRSVVKEFSCESNDSQGYPYAMVRGSTRQNMSCSPFCQEVEPSGFTRRDTAVSITGTADLVVDTSADREDAAPAKVEEADLENLHDGKGQFNAGNDSEAAAGQQHVPPETEGNSALFSDEP